MTANGHSAKVLDLSARLGLSPGEAAEALGLSRSSVYALFNAEALHSLKVGRRRIIPRSEIDRLLNAKASSPAA